MGAAAHDKALLIIVVARPGGETLGHDPRGQLIELGAALLDFALDTGARFGEGKPGDTGIDIVRGLLQGGDGQALGQGDDAVLDVAVLADQNREHLASAEIDELDLLQPFALLVDEHDPGAA